MECVLYCTHLYTHIYTIGKRTKTIKESVVKMLSGPRYVFDSFGSTRQSSLICALFSWAFVHTSKFIIII